MSGCINLGFDFVSSKVLTWKNNKETIINLWHWKNNMFFRPDQNPVLELWMADCQLLNWLNERAAKRWIARGHWRAASRPRNSLENRGAKSRIKGGKCVANTTETRSALSFFSNHHQPYKKNEHNLCSFGSWYTNQQDSYLVIKRFLT